MTEQLSSAPQATLVKLKSPRRTGVIVLAIIGGVITACIFLVAMLVLFFRNAQSVKARNAIIGTELREDGHILKDNRIISVNVEKIYLEFYFENPVKSNIPLVFRWYIGDQLLYSYSGIHENGYVIAILSRDPNNLASFPPGNYHVEVLFGNTMILSEPFVVK